MRKPKQSWTHAGKTANAKREMATMSNLLWAASHPASRIWAYQGEIVLLPAYPFDLFPWVHMVSPFAEMDVCIVDGDRQFTARISFWLWLSRLATLADLYKLTCQLQETERVDKHHPRLGGLRHAAEVKRQTKSLAGVAEPIAARVDHGVASGEVQAADSIRRQSCKRNGAALLIDSAAISEDAMRGLIDDWIVPAVVDRLIRELLAEPPEGKKG